MIRRNQNPSRRAPGRCRAAGLVGAAALALAVAACGGDSGDEAGGCLSGLAEHLTDDPSYVGGSDLSRARDAGFDDSGDSEALYESVLATGVSPDPLVQRSLALLTPLDELPYAPSDVECWAGTQYSFVARGSFDADEVAASAGPEGPEVADDLLAWSDDTDPASLLEPSEPRDDIEIALGVLDDEEVAGLALSRGYVDGPLAAIGVAHTDAWDVVGVWTFADDDAAVEGAERVAAILSSGESSLPDLVTGDPAAGLETDGRTVTLRAPLADQSDVAAVSALVQRFDPVLLTSRP